MSVNLKHFFVPLSVLTFKYAISLIRKSLTQHLANTISL